MWNGENLIYQETKTCIMKYRTDIELINGTFELIEDNTIDIESIEELDINYKECVDLGNNTIFDYHNNTRTAINELIQAVKQLNKEIKSIKEK